MLALDTETALFRPGRMAPELACVSWAKEGASGLFHWQDPELLPWLEDAFLGEIVGQNIAYDTCVLSAQFPSLTPIIFKAYNESRITDTMLREQLADIANGRFRGYHDKQGVWRRPRYNLESLARKYSCAVLDKDTWRKQYGQLRDLPLVEWPTGAKEYAELDAITTLQIYERQEEMPDEREQARAYFALQLASVWGIRTHEDGVRRLKEQTIESINELRDRLLEEGLVRADGTRNLKRASERIEAAWKAIGEEEPPRTDPSAKFPDGQLRLDAESCLDCEDPVMRMYGEFTTLNKVLGTDVVMLEKGTVQPIHTRFGLVETTRTSSSSGGTDFGGNIQNIRRLPGIRECFVPRKGWVFVEVDYPTLEMRTFAEVCYEWLGFSDIGEAFKNDYDTHLIMAGVMLHISYEEAVRRYEAGDVEVKAARQLCKIANYGFMGGLGAESFIDFSYTGSDKQIRLTIEDARNVKAVWTETWPEVKPYFALINSFKGTDGKYRVEHVHTGIKRACSSFCKAANSPFQSMGASCAKRGLWNVTNACYNNPDSVLYGGRLVNFIHDSVIVEFPLAWGPGRMSAAAMEMALLFDAGAKKYLTRVPIKSHPIMMNYWSKDAKPKYENGLLIPWK